MISTAVGVIAAKFMGIGMWLYHIKFQLELLTLNIKAIIGHFKFAEGMSVGMKVRSLIPG